MEKLTADLVAQLLQMTQKQGRQRANSGPLAMDWFGEGPLSDWSVATSQGGRWEGGDAGSWVNDPNDVQTYFSKSVGDDINDVYDSQGNFIEQQGPQENSKWGGLYPLAKLAAAAGTMYAGASGLEGLLGGGLGGADAGLGALADAGITGGGYAPALAGPELGGLEGLISSMGGSPFSLGLEGGALSMPAFGSVLPAAGGLAGASALTGAGGGASSPSFLDKLATNSSDFFSKPMNLLNTAGILGSLYENSQDPDPVNTTATENKATNVTRNLDPAISEALFGADRSGGLMSQMQGYFAKNPTGQNDTMRDAQAGMRGLLTNPDVLSSLYKAGAAGQGLLTGGANAGAKPWWWKG